MSEFDSNRAQLKGPDFFPRFEVKGAGIPIEAAKLDDDLELVIAERDGLRAGFLMREIGHPHMAQGTFGDKPYLVTF